MTTEVFTKRMRCFLWLRRDRLLFGWILLQLLCCGYRGEGEAQARDARFLSHQAWSTEEGLPQASVHGIFQSSDGYLWLATEGGVARFDAVGFKSFTHENDPAFASDDVSSIAEGPAGTMWFGTSDGLVRSQGASMRRLSQADGLPSSSILSLASTSDGALLALTTEGLARVDGSGVHTVRDVPAAIKSLQRAADGTVWLLGAREPVAYRNGLFAPVGLAKPGDETVLGIQNGAGGAVWMQTARSVIVSTGAKRRVLRIGRELAGSRVQSLLIDRSGTAWIGTNGGLFTTTSLGNAPVQRVDALRTDSILCLFEDHEGNFWVGTESSGLHSLRPRKFRAEGASMGDGVTAVIQASDGAIWYGTRGQGLRCLRDGRLAAAVPATALTSPVILSLAPGVHGDLWAGTPDGLNHIDHGSVHKYSAADGLPDDFVRSVLVSRDGSVWAGTRSGLAHLAHEKVISYSKADGLPSNSIGPLLETGGSPPQEQAGSEQLWVGTAAGLALLQDGKVASPLALSHGIIMATTQDQAGAIWIGVHNAGLGLLVGQSFRKITAQGLPADIHELTIDAAGYLWLRDNHGVYRGSVESLRHCADASKPCMASVEHYGVADGMPSDELTAEGTPSLWRGEDGVLWCATRKGLALARPLMLPIDRVPPPVSIERFTVDAAEQPLNGQSLRIGSGHRSFTFDYAALSYTMPLKTRYRYKLEGLDRDWIDAGSRRTAYYTSLPGRSYRFRVIAENNDGIWNETGAELRFVVSPPFYLRWWFYLLLLALLSAGSAMALQIRLRGVRRQFLLVLNERNRVAREIHDTLAQDLVSVSLQLDLVQMLVRANNVPQATQQIQETRSLVKKGLKSARQSIWNRRANAEQTSLPTQLGKTVEEFRRRHPAVRLNIGGTYRKLDHRTEQEVFRIAQECLSNVDRHASADEVSVDLRYESESLTLTVRDDGRGFSYEAGEDMDGHYGVRGIQERAATLRGRLTITTKPGKGTTVVLAVPLSAKEGRRTE